MRLFGGRLSVISVPELLDYASCTKARVRLELCNCKELGKLVVRVAGLSRRGGKERQLGVLVHADSEDYFVAARSIGGMQSKLDRLLMPIRNRIDIVPLENGVLRLFRGGTITEIGNSIMGGGAFCGSIPAFPE